MGTLELKYQSQQLKGNHICLRKEINSGGSNEWSFEVQDQNVTFTLESSPAKVPETKQEANAPGNHRQCHQWCFPGYVSKTEGFSHLDLFAVMHEYVNCKWGNLFLVIFFLRIDFIQEKQPSFLTIFFSICASPIMRRKATNTIFQTCALKKPSTTPSI